MDLGLAGLVQLIAIGLAAGFLSSLFGIGGGLVMVPLLHYGLGVPFAHATIISLLAMAIQTPMGIYQHLRRDAVSWPLAIPMVCAGAVGVVLGLVLQPRVPVPALKLLFAFLMLVAAYRLVARPPTRILPIGTPAVAAIGAVAGLASRLLGIGGGLVTVPLLAMGGVPIHLAVGSSLVPVFTNAALASAVSLAGGLDPKPALVLALGAILASPLGAWLAHALAAPGLKRAFAGVLTVAAVYVALTSGAVGP